MRQACPAARVLLVGSSKQYGAAAGPVAIRETARCLPENELYGVSKQAVEMIGARYAAQFAMDVCFTRSFNHTGPGQSPHFVCSDWAQQAAKIELGRAEPVIRVGDVDQQIDFCDVADVVRAYHCILEKGCPGRVYNVCSGKATALRSLLDAIIAKSTKKISIVEDPARLHGRQGRRTTVGDHSLLTADTGWSPEIYLEKTGRRPLPLLACRPPGGGIGLTVSPPRRVFFEFYRKQGAA